MPPSANLPISSKIKKYLQTLNLFQSIPLTNDPDELRSQILSTRLFIGTMLLCLSILLIYTSTVRLNKLVIEPTPSLDRYKVLHEWYFQTLTCSCKQTAVELENMLRIDYTLHQVCSSFLVSEDWLDFLKGVRRWYDSVGFLLNLLNFHQKDLRVFSSLIFQGLVSLCKLAIEAIEYNIKQAYASRYTNPNLLSPTDLQAQTQMIVESLKSSTITQLLLSMRMIRDITQVNAIASTVQSNALYRTTWTQRSFRFNIYDGCACVRSAQCSEGLSMYEDDNITYTAPGMYVGCYVLEALLQSNFDCFYHSSCFNTMIDNMYPNASLRITTMNISIPSRFRTNDTVQELFDELMVEEWRWVFLYEQYFNTCQPMECRYTYQSRSSVVYIFTTLFGVIGGLSTSLKILIPRLVQVIRRRRRQNAVPNNAVRVIPYNAGEIPELPVGK